MKNLKKYILLLCILSSATILAQTSNSSIQEAANKGKTELLRILSERSDFKLGVSASDIDGSETGNPIEEFSTDFKKLLNNQAQDLLSISTRTEKFIVPLLKNGKVMTTITVASTPKSTKTVELVNRQYTSEINQMPRATYIKDLKLIQVPNLNAALYVTGNTVFTSYKGRNIQEPVSLSELTAELQSDARIFESKYGEKLRKGKLVR